MANGVQEVKPGNSALETAIGKLRSLSSESKVAIISAIDRLADAEGISVRADPKPPLENIILWRTKLRSERKS